MKKAYIIGVHMVKCGKYLEHDHRELTQWTVDGVLADAGIDKSDLKSAHFSNSLWGYYNGQDAIRGHIAMRHCGIDKIPVINLESACASGTLALHSAWKDIQTGLFDCTLAIGVEKMIMNDKAKMFKAFDVFTDVVKRAEIEADYKKNVAAITIEIPEYDQQNRSVFMDIYALRGLYHMQKYGTTMEAFAHVAAKNHHNGSMNPNAQYQFDMTTQEVLADKMVSYPLTRSMCSPMSDGAASAILCSEEFFRKLPESVQTRGVEVLASLFYSGRDMEDPGNEENSAAIGVRKAYEIAGKTPTDMDVAEVHDATAVGELLHYENLGFCPVGKGGEFALSGATEIGGKIPVNPSGGLISKGHPIAASGLGQIHELVTQLRGEAGDRQVKGARTAIAENGGGSVRDEEAAFAITILEKAGR